MQLLRYLNSRNVDEQSFLKRLSLDKDSLIGQDARIPASTYLRIQEAAEAAAKDPEFGLHMGRMADLGTYSMAGYVFMNCADLGEVFQKAGRYNRLVGELIEGHPRFGWGTVTIEYAPASPTYRPTQACYESLIAGSVVMIRTLTGGKVSPVDAVLARTRFQAMNEWEETLGCPVRAGKSNHLTFSIADLKTPIVMANPSLLRHFDRLAMEMLESLQNESRVAEFLMRTLSSMVGREDLALRVAARKMRLEPRSLQRKLAAEGKTFRSVCADFKRGYACALLRSGETVEEIAFILGYSDSAAFRKAFKEWMSVTPGEYRSSCVRAAPITHST